MTADDLRALSAAATEGPWSSAVGYWPCPTEQAHRVLEADRG